MPVNLSIFMKSYIQKVALMSKVIRIVAIHVYFLVKIRYNYKLENS